MKDIYSDLLQFDLAVGTEKNYFIQSGKGAFHLSLGEHPKSRCIIASPAGNAGSLITFEDKSPVQLVKPLRIEDKETVSFSISGENKIINLAVLGSIRIIRAYTESVGIDQTYDHLQNILQKIDTTSSEHKNLTAWLSPEWELSNDNKTAVIKINSLNNKDFYELKLESSKGKFNIIEKLKPSIGINSKLQLPSNEIKIVYTSSFKPLTPFPVKELFNKEALSILEKLEAEEKKNAILNLNALRFLAYKEKFLAGSWRFLTYFGRDTLLSIRMLAPILTPAAFEAEFRGISEHLNDAGEIAHEEDLGEQSAIDQLNQWYTNGFNDKLSIEDKMISDFISVDTNYLALPLLLDYYYINGRKLFSAENSLFIPILKNINFVLKEASVQELVEIRKGINVGDWRDSQDGLAYGRYAFSVNAAMIPSAIISLSKLIEQNAWDIMELKNAAVENNFTHINSIIEKPEILKKAVEFWTNIWKKFLVKNDNYKDGILALSLDQNKNPIPIIQSDTLFMLLDFPIDNKNEWLYPACNQIGNEIPKGLMCDAGMLVASPEFAPQQYKKMFDRNHYHGQVVWAWQNLMLKIALQKQLNKWVIPSHTNIKLEKIQEEILQQMLNRISQIIEALSEWSTSELWSWKDDSNGKIIPAVYGQASGDNAESNAVQLWSAAALGSQLWDKMEFLIY